MVKNAEDIANQIRKILHASWPRSEHKYLKVLQKCGVALMKAIEDKKVDPHKAREVLEGINPIELSFMVSRERVDMIICQGSENSEVRSLSLDLIYKTDPKARPTEEEANRIKKIIMKPAEE